MSDVVKEVTDVAVDPKINNFISTFDSDMFLGLLFGFLSLGPAVQQVLATAAWPIWPLLLGAAITGSLAFLSN